MRRQDAAAAALLGVILFAIAGCAPPPVPSPVVPGTHPEPAAACATVLSQAWLDKFVSWNLVAGSPAGVVLAPRPTSDFTHCVWTAASSAVGITTVEIDFGPVTDANRASVTDFLGGLGLLETTTADSAMYSSSGSTTLPARLDVLRPASWLTVAIAPGTATNLEQATQIAGDVATNEGL